MCIIRGKDNLIPKIQFDQKSPIKELNKHQIDKYLWTVETAGFDHYSICIRTKKKYFDRIKKY